MDNKLAASFLADLPFPAAEEGVPELFLVKRERPICRCAWRVTDSRQLTAADETVAWFDPSRMGEAPALPAPITAAIAGGALTAIDIGNPKWREALTYFAPKSAKKRVNLLAVGDVGSTLLTALKLLGGDVISSIGICDLSDKTIARWTTEMGQIGWPWNYDALPEVEAVDMDHLFECDVFIFAATKAIPAVGSGIKDVRMAQLEANAGIVSHYARMARNVDYKGLFMVLSDPVDQLCQSAYNAS
ncbi:MAG: lactate dehydrogenase, partial [Oscillibacter sp.]|nr:lactate dehydrogenase [Oscillibacter sp.]